MLREHVERIVTNCDGAVAGVVMGFDGIAVESYSGSHEMDVKAMGMEYSFVLNQVRKAAEILEVGGLEEVAIRSEKMTFLIRVLNEEYFLGLAMRPDGNFGKGRFLIRMALPELQSQL